MLTFFQKFFGSANDRMVQKLKGKIKEINKLEPTVSVLKDEALQAKTAEFKGRLAQGETLDDLLPEAFAVVRETSKRVLGERHYDVQLMGGMVLHQGMIAEMKTGEGKTLVSTLAVYLNALTGKGVHLVTINDYLAKRDADWMGRIYRFLGLTVGCIENSMGDDERREAYAADITYVTNNELGFDYLRDNMKFRLSDMVQRPFQYAIVDEMDSILIDEARTPLIISGPTNDSSDLYEVADKIAKVLLPEDYEKDEKHHNATLTDLGMEKVEVLYREAGVLKSPSLYDIQNIACVHHINQALKAQVLFHKDKEYIVKDGKIIIIDEFTGRMMDGRRYSDGLHQALEAKEGVAIQTENQTLASITFQNLFRLYPKLAGMSGTAITEAAEFGDIYNLEVVALPPHVPIARKDSDDEVYRTEKEKHKAILTLLRTAITKKQPVLIGTASIEKSEVLSKLLQDNKIAHNVLNARYHDQEAKIIAEAGKPGAITIATNMAGRGTDIKLGGHFETRLATALEDKDNISDTQRLKIEAQVREALTKDQAAVRESGGLYIIGTERHESRRIDNQLRGRSGRQGDVGGSKFFLSLQDDLMRIFGSERLDTMLQRFGLKEDEAIIHPWINKAIERAQSKVEARNFDMRKHLLKYDDVMNDQRRVIYEQRRDIMNSESVSDIIEDMILETIDAMVEQSIPPKAYPNQWDLHSLHEECLRIFGLDLPIKAWGEEEGIAEAAIKERITKAVTELHQKKFVGMPPEIKAAIEKSLLLSTLDQTWKDHLLLLDHLRQGINLRAYGQKDPLNEYKRDAFGLFEKMLQRLREEIANRACHFNFETGQAPTEVEDTLLDLVKPTTMILNRDENPIIPAMGPKVRQKAEANPQDPATWGRVPRNSPCPCGSEKKYKNCHGAL